MRRKSKKMWSERMGTAAFAAALSLLLSLEGVAAENGRAIAVATSGNAMAVSDAEGGDEDGLSPEVRETVAASLTEAGGRKRISAEKKDRDILSVKLPVVAEKEPSPFDFFLDPCGLLYETDAVRYGGGTVEEGATLLFHNQGSGYAFSRYSDKISVADGEEEPILVTVSASVSDLDGIALVGREDLWEEENPCMYLALTDDQGNERPILPDAEAVIRMELDSGVYSFGLTGECNPDGDWQEMSVHPKVTVTWHVESALTKEEELEEEILLIDDVTGRKPAPEESSKPPAGDTVSTEAGPEKTAGGKKDSGTGEDILPKENVTEGDPAQEEPQKPPVEDAVSEENAVSAETKPGGEAGGKLPEEGTGFFDGESGESAGAKEPGDSPGISAPSAEENGVQVPDTSGDDSEERIPAEEEEDSVSDSDVSDESSAEAVSPAGTESDISDSPEPEESSETAAKETEAEDAPVAAGTGEDTDDAK